MMDTDRSIAGVAKTISEILSKKKYAIDYYQREYKWERKQLEELVSDLTNKFLQLYPPGRRTLPRLLPGIDHRLPEGRAALRRRWAAATHQPHPFPHLPASTAGGTRRDRLDRRPDLLRELRREVVQP